MQDVLRMPSVEHATTGHEYFSLADTTQFEETIIEGYRGDLDANAALPPLKHDVYSAVIKYAESWPGKDKEPLALDPARRWRKKIASDGQLMWMTFVTRTTLNNVDPAVDNRQNTTVVTTYPTKQGTTGVQALLQGMDVDTLMLNSHEAQMIALDKQIAGEGAMVGVEIDWEASVYDKDMAQRDKSGQPILDDNGEPKMGVELWKLRGMKKFPDDGNGGYEAEINEKNNGGKYSYRMPGSDGKPTGEPILVKEARVRNFDRRYVPFSKLQGASQLETDLAASVQQVEAAKATASAAAAAQSRPAAPVQAAPAAQQASAATAAAQTRPAAPGGRPGPRRVTA